MSSSAFEDMLAMMDAALDLPEEDEKAAEAFEALGLPDEQAEEEEDLPEPLVGPD